MLAPEMEDGPRGSAAPADEPLTLVGTVRGMLLRVMPRPPPGVRFFRPKAIRQRQGVVVEVREHGLPNAMRRIVPTVLSNALAGTLLFRAYESTHRRFARPESALDAAACGAFGGAVHASFACPLAALLAGRRRALWAALPIFLSRDVLGFGAFFATWHSLHARALPARPSRATELGTAVAAGGVAGAVYHVWSAPFELGKAHARPSLYALSIEIRRYGVRDMLRGAASSARGAVVASSVAFLVAELIFDHELPAALLAELAPLGLDKGA